MSTNDIKMNKIQNGGLLFAKKSDDLTWNDPKTLCRYIDLGPTEYINCIEILLIIYLTTSCRR